MKGDGVWLDHTERYEATDEYLTVWRRMLAGETFDFTGKHIKVEGAKLLFPPVQAPHPPLYFGGSSGPGQAVAARHADVYLTWGEPPAEVAVKIADAREAAAREGRTMSFGIRLHVIVRETEAEAWAAADSLIKHVDDRAIETAQKAFANSTRSGSAAWPNCTKAIGTISSSARTSGPASVLSVAAPARHWSAIRSRSRIA